MAALIELILERGDGTLTIDDVVERANVGRSTLYAHFGGLDGILKQSLTRPSLLLAEIVDRDVSPGDLALLLDHFKDQRKRNRAFFVHPIRGLWVGRLAELMQPRLEALARGQARSAPQLPWSFVATQLADNQLSLVANWLAMRVATPSEVIAAAMIAVTRATVDGLGSARASADGTR